MDPVPVVDLDSIDGRRVGAAGAQLAPEVVELHGRRVLGRHLPDHGVVRSQPGRRVLRPGLAVVLLARIEQGEVIRTISAPVDVPVWTACSNDCFRSASNAGSPMCIHLPPIRRSDTSQRPARRITTLGWNCSRSPLHCAGHWPDLGVDVLHWEFTGEASP